MDKKLRKSLIITLITIVILGLMVTSAYFAVTVSNTNNEKINSTSGKISLIYTDCASSKQSDCANMTKNLAPEVSIEKTFKVRNTGTESVDYKIIFKQLTNTFQNGDLVYTIKDLSDNVLQSERPVPYSSSQTTNVNAFLDTISANTTKEFKIVIKLKETTDDQTVNASATYSIKIGLTIQNGGTDNIYNLVNDANPGSVDVITKTAPSGASCTNTLAYDGTVDNNLRYVGENPCNYVTFNNEEAGWRIIGVMNNIDDGTGKQETRMKLIRKDSLGNYSWDSSASEVNGGYGINDWTQADLKNELNGDYLDTTLTSNTMWYNGSKNKKTGEYDYTKGLKASAQSLIGDAKWNLGGANYSQLRTQGTASQFYKYERGTQVWGGETGQVCNDGACPRATQWIGKVALLYPSDFGYAVGSNIRANCLNKSMYDFDNNGCNSDNWLKSNNESDWSLTMHSDDNSRIMDINVLCYLGSMYAINSRSVLPSIYLKSNIQISGGNGSINNPYTLK